MNGKLGQWIPAFVGLLSAVLVAGINYGIQSERIDRIEQLLDRHTLLSIHPGAGERSAKLETRADQLEDAIDRIEDSIKLLLAQRFNQPTYRDPQ